jgi:hypothetical protein
MEQQVSAQIAVGTFNPLNSKQAVELLDKERQVCKMRLLRSSQLIGDLRYALGRFRACPHCQMVGGKQRPCGAHKLQLLKAKRAIHWAAEDNLARRAAAGTMRPDDEGELHDGAPNEWEAWYFADRRLGIWPGTKDSTFTQSELARMKEQYGSLDYRGWLQMLLEEEEITLPAYTTELSRLRGETTWRKSSK